MKGRTLLHWRRRLLAGAAALPLFQFFSGCFPNVPGIPNLPGAVSFELQNLFSRVVGNTLSIIIANLLDL